MNGLLKFITCGSVDDGKSTLIGHMLYDAKLIFADQEKALMLDSKVGSRAGEIDYSLLLDGLMAEREQGITIDVAYRYFTTDKRSFIVADTPGHEEYTRNMAVGASFAELAVILVDATQGVLTQTRRHTRICSLMGIKHFVFAVNKMDLVGYSEGKYKSITKTISVMMREFSASTVKIIPVSATDGDNITKSSDNTPWYTDEPLLTYLETVDTDEGEAEAGFSMPVQRVCRPDRTFRGFQGQIETGSVKIGDRVISLPSNEIAEVKSILNAGKKVERAFKGQAVTIEFNREIDVSRGCVLVSGVNPTVGNRFTAKILWMDDNKLTAGKNYLLKLSTKTIPAVILEISHKINVNDGSKISADAIFKNEIAVCEISTSERIVFDKFGKNPALGSLILIDRITHMTSACGVIEHSINKADNITRYNMDITRAQRAALKGQKPKTIWLTGLSGSGKSTLANELEKRLYAEGKHTMTLDGDNVRFGLNKNLGFSEADRIENIRRIAEVSRLMNDAGLIVITSFVSPFKRDRRAAAEIIGKENFVEIYVSTPLSECERRDVKGLYKKARLGRISDFTGISSPYEAPERPHLTIDTTGKTVEESCDFLQNKLRELI